MGVRTEEAAKIGEVPMDLQEEIKVGRSEGSTSAGRASDHKVVLQGAAQLSGTIRTYVDSQQATVVEWVATQPIFYVCARDTGYAGGGRLRVLWLSQKTT